MLTCLIYRHMGTVGISRTIAEKEWRPNTTWASVLHSALPEAWGLQRQLVFLMVNKRAPEGTRVPGLVWQAVFIPQPRAANLIPTGGDFRLQSGSPASLLLDQGHMAQPPSPPDLWSHSLP